MKGLDIIIPVHKYDEDIQMLLSRCLTSLKDIALNNKNNIKLDIIIVGPDLLLSKDITTDDLKSCFNTFTIAENKSGSYDFCSQVNYATNNLCSNDYFMIVEFDDMVTPKWIDMALPYIMKRKKCPMFLPLVEVYDIKDSLKPKFYINEIAWSSSFSEDELGCLSTNTLMDYCNFNITGAIINRDKFNKAGGLKSSIKLSFGYELMLRLSNLYAVPQTTEGNIFVIPKVGYFHFINRDDSLTSEYHNTMSKEEGAWWIKLATEEYTYKRDRQKTYPFDNNNINKED